MQPRQRICQGGVALAFWAAAAAVVSATVVVPVEFGEMVQASHTIVHGTVVDVRAQLVGSRRTIESLVTVDVIGTLKGTPGPRVTFKVPGGQVGRYRRVMVGAPVFGEGDEIVLFLSGPGPGVPLPFGLSQGVYRVTRLAGRATVAPLVEGEPGRIVRGDPARRPLAIADFAAAVAAAIDGSRP